MVKELEDAQQLISAAQKVCEAITAYLVKVTDEGGAVSIRKLDKHQLAAYDLAYLMAEVKAAEQTVSYAVRLNSDLQRELALSFVAEMIIDFSARIGSRLSEFGLNASLIESTLGSDITKKFMREVHPAKSYGKIRHFLDHPAASITYGLDEEHELIRKSFRKLVEEKVIPIAEEVHRKDLLVPETIIQELSQMGCFGLSIPQCFGGYQEDTKPDNMGMVIVTEELSRGSLGLAGSLITRPEILSKALLKGGTDEQKQKWLPSIAAGEVMVSVAVTEPDYGSDVASITLTAKKSGTDWVLNGAKIWCTFAGRAEILMVLARTDPDLSKKHRGLSVFIVEKPKFEGHVFEFTQPGGGRIFGRAIPTIGYRGMHSYEVVFENYHVPEENLIGREAGLGKGFYLQMEGFSGGRLQTAARANGVMQAAFEQALRYAYERKVFGVPIIDYQLTQYKLARMLTLIQASRQLTYHVARLFDQGEGQMEASLVKFFASKISEWVTREAMQIHGGMGYAEEYAVSRYFLDARVFSLFEGTEEILALRVIVKSLLDEYVKRPKLDVC